MSMTKAVMYSINRPHTDNIKNGAKKSELRTKPPRINEPYKAYIYEPKKNGGCGKVIGEFTAFNEYTYRMCMGVPKHLVISGCISVEEIWAYSNKGEKDLTEISISDFVFYDKPKELTDFCVPCREYDKKHPKCGECEYGYIENNERKCYCDGLKPFNRPPQSWCYVERVG